MSCWRVNEKHARTSQCTAAAMAHSSARFVKPPLVDSRFLQERDDPKRLELANGLTGGVLLRSAQGGVLNPEQGQALSERYF